MLEWLASLHISAIIQIIGIDLLLGADNALLIGLACKDLPTTHRRAGIVWGTLGALALRFIFVCAASWLLHIPLLSAVGGVLLLVIAVRLGVGPNKSPTQKASDQSAQYAPETSPQKQLWNAIRLIVVADALMSIDNALGLAGVANTAPPDQRFFLVGFGLLLSLPIIVFASQGVLRALERFAWLIGVGAALLGWIAIGLILEDPFTQHLGALTPAYLPVVLKGAGAALVLGVVSIMKSKRLNILK